MGTNTRPELSSANKYYIERHRYYELKHFCLQYPYWQRRRVELKGYLRSPAMREKVYGGSVSDPTARIADELALYSSRIETVERAAKKTDDVLGVYILKAVTQGLPYEAVKSKSEIPCCRDVYYTLYRRFFFLLDHERD